MKILKLMMIVKLKIRLNLITILVDTNAIDFTSNITSFKNTCLQFRLIQGFLLRGRSGEHLARRLLKFALIMTYLTAPQWRKPSSLV